MLTLSILVIPLIGIFTIVTNLLGNSKYLVKFIGLSTSLINLVVTLVIFILFDFSSSQFQFVQEYYEMNGYNIYLGIDGLSVYFVLLTSIIMPIAILSNWSNIDKKLDNITWYIIILLLLETLLLAVFLVLDIFLFYISFESILPPLFLLIGIFGSSNKVRASFYLFLYTLLGSLFLLLSILTIYSVMGTTDYHVLFNKNFEYITQLFLFYGIFIAFAVKTPTIFLNTWLLKAHVESPLGGSIILAGIVLKLSLYGILRLILPILPKASLDYTYIVYLIGVISIIYASFSTLRTIDVKELIAYSSVSHAAVYLLGVFSNTLQGIGGAIVLGLAHGFVSSGLFMCTGGVLYDRSSTRLITYYKGITQIMPLFSIIFFILCLSNAGTPLSLNFVGEFLSLYGTFERLPLMGVLASSSIILSAAYTMYMFNRISFGGTLSKYFKVNMPDVNKREFILLFTLLILTIILGIYPSIIIDGLNFGLSTLIYSSSMSLYADATINSLVQASGSIQHILELHSNIVFYIFIASAIISLIITSITKPYKSLDNNFMKVMHLIGKYTLIIILTLFFIAFPYLMIEIEKDGGLDYVNYIYDLNYDYGCGYDYDYSWFGDKDLSDIGEDPLEYNSYKVPQTSHESYLSFADSSQQPNVPGGNNSAAPGSSNRTLPPLDQPGGSGPGIPNEPIVYKFYLYEFHELAKVIYGENPNAPLAPNFATVINRCENPTGTRTTLDNFFNWRLNRSFNFDTTRVTGHRDQNRPLYEIYKYLREVGYDVEHLQGTRWS